MSILTPSGLETVNYSQENWEHIINANFEKVNYLLQKVERLYDVDSLVASKKRTGAFLAWNSTVSRWKLAKRI